MSILYSARTRAEHKALKIAILSLYCIQLVCVLTL